jgi:cytochrome b subunit of formate dehydrogenase
MQKVVERERNKTYYRVLHVPLWIWVFWILPGNLTLDLYAHGPDRRHWTWLAIVTAVCIWRGAAGRLPGVEPAPYVTHHGEEKPNQWYRITCYTAAWIDLLAPFSLNLAGLIINAVSGRWTIGALYHRWYYVVAAVIVLATLFGLTPRARRSTRDEGAEKAWFYVAVWTVVPTQATGWAMWRLGKYLAISASTLNSLRLLTFVVVAALFLAFGVAGKLPRTRRYHLPPEWVSAEAAVQ